MIRKEPKLRPSLAVSDMLLLSKVLHEDITTRIKAGNTSAETLNVARLKDYIDSFKPAQIDNMALLSKYMQAPDGTTSGGSVAELQTSMESTQHASCLDNPELTDEQRYDMLVLRGESTFTEREKEFYNINGFQIKMMRMQRATVKTGDL